MKNFVQAFIGGFVQVWTDIKYACTDKYYYRCFEARFGVDTFKRLRGDPSRFSEEYSCEECDSEWKRNNKTWLYLVHLQCMRLYYAFYPSIMLLFDLVRATWLLCLSVIIGLLLARVTIHLLFL